MSTLIIYTIRIPSIILALEGKPGGGGGGGGGAIYDKTTKRAVEF